MKSLFHLTKSQRKGILTLLFLIILVQTGYFFWKSKRTTDFKVDEVAWKNMQTWIDSVSSVNPKDSIKIYPFNPNFITDYKAYQLGISTTEYDRLRKYRAENKFVNSAVEFQKITGISDSLLAQISPYFKFPEWVSKHKSKNFWKNNSPKKKTLSSTEKIDINKASYEDLIEVYGIGPATANRILDFKEKLGAFVSLEQLYDIWGLKPEVVFEIEKSFHVVEGQNFKKLNINKANMKSISDFPYFNYTLAKEIVTYRTMNNGITKIEDLTKINGFPVDKLKIIDLYLEF